MLSLYQKLNPDDQPVIAPVLLNNCYFCHPENILLAGVADEDFNVRKFSCDAIIKARVQRTSAEVRCFDKKQVSVNLKATSYIDMVDWDRSHVTTPPLLDGINNEQLMNYQQVILPKYPCHSVDIERNVKDVTAVSARVFGHTSRHGAIIQKKKSRSDTPIIQTKANFL